MASVVVVSGIMGFFINIKGHRELLCGQDSDEVLAAWKKLGDAGGTLVVPAAETAKAVEDKDTDSEADFKEFEASLKPNHAGTDLNEFMESLKK